MSNNKNVYRRDYPNNEWGREVSMTITKGMYNNYIKDFKSQDELMDYLTKTEKPLGIITELIIEG